MTDTVARAHATPSAPPDGAPGGQSRLLSLPLELQLQIYEYAITVSDPLLLNCPCDSSFGGWTLEYDEARQLWFNGSRKPPVEPALTRTCRAIRRETLAMFYLRNAFQAGYCFNTDQTPVLSWLQRLGPKKRAWLKDFYYFDENPMHDVNNDRSDLEKIRSSKVCKELGGFMVSMSTKHYCRHNVTFSPSTLGALQ